MTFAERKKLVDTKYPKAAESFNQWFAYSGLSYRNLGPCRDAWYAAMMRAASITHEQKGEMVRWVINNDA